MFDDDNRRGHINYGIKKLDECTSGMVPGVFVVLALDTCVFLS